MAQLLAAVFKTRVRNKRDMKFTDTDPVHLAFQETFGSLYRKDDIIFLDFVIGIVVDSHSFLLLCSFWNKWNKFSNGFRCFLIRLFLGNKG